MDEEQNSPIYIKLLCFTCNMLIYKCALASKVLFLVVSFTLFFSAAFSSPLKRLGTFPFPVLFSSSSSSNSLLPSISVNLSTRLLTVAPSRRFLPSRRDLAIFSVKSQSFPSARRTPVAGSREGRHVGPSWIRGGILESLDLTTWMSWSSWKRRYEFLRVSLLTASK